MFDIFVVVVFVVVVVVVAVVVAVAVVAVVLACCCCCCCSCHFFLLPPRSFEKKDQLKNLSEILHKTLATNFTGTWIAKKLVKYLREAFTNSYAQRSIIAILDFVIYLDNSLLLFVLQDLATCNIQRFGGFAETSILIHVRT